MFLLLKQNLQVPLFRKLKHEEVRKLSQSVNTSRPTCQVCYMAGIFLHLVQPRNLYQLVKSISTNWNCVWHGKIKVIHPSSKWLQTVWKKNENHLLQLLSVMGTVFLSPTWCVKLHCEMKLHTIYGETFFTST
jgi:hypothetical protein